MPYSRRFARRRRYVRKRTRKATRPARLRRTYRRTMTRRSILNLTSTKKRDNMLTWVPSNGANPGGPGTTNPLVLPSDAVIRYNLFSPTFRNLDNDAAFKDEISARTKTDTYSKGYREATSYRVIGPTPWRIRRIVFTAKGLPSYLAAANPAWTSDFYGLYTSNGYVRQTDDMPTARVNDLTTVLFQGALAVDWQDVFTAKVDTSRVKLLSDKTFNINPPNQSGKAVTIKHWYPTGKLLRYADDENGISETSSPFSTFSKVGMGDMFIFDMYQSISAAALPTENITVHHEGTYYWHER